MAGKKRIAPDDPGDTERSAIRGLLAELDRVWLAPEHDYVEEARVVAALKVYAARYNTPAPPPVKIGPHLASHVVEAAIDAAREETCHLMYGEARARSYACLALIELGYPEDQVGRAIFPRQMHGKFACWQVQARVRKTGAAWWSEDSFLCVLEAAKAAGID